MSKKIKTVSHSKILKCIVACLEKGKFPHVLQWNNRVNKEFIIVFVHKNNPAWHVSYLDLFKELDGLSKKKLELYVGKPDYESACKVRCKSNLKKLCIEGALSVCWKKKQNKSKFLMCYKINDASGIYLSHSEEHEMEQKQKAYGMTMSNRNAQGTIGDKNNELLITSHFPCLSTQAMSNSSETIQGDMDNIGILETYGQAYEGIKEGTISHECTGGLGSTNMLTNQKSIKNGFNMGNLALNVDRIFHECTGGSGSTNMLTNQESIRNGLDIRNLALNGTISHECTGGSGATNMLTNQKMIKNEFNVGNLALNDTISHECAGGFEFTNMLTNQKSIKNGSIMRNVTFHDDRISHECTGGLGSTNMMTNKINVKNGYVLLNDELMFHHEVVPCDDYGESADFSLYQNVQGTLDLHATNKVSVMYLEDANVDRNAVSPDRLGNTEDSFYFNSLDPFSDYSLGGLRMDEDPFVCCGSCGSCSCKDV